MIRDLLQAVRWLRRNPLFTACAVLILALGIGATTAVFSIVDAVLLRPLPYVQADRLARIDESAANRLISGVPGTDPVIYVSTAVLLLVIGAAASIGPAWRAAAGDPVKALRME